MPYLRCIRPIPQPMVTHAGFRCQRREPTAQGKEPVVSNQTVVIAGLIGLAAVTLLCTMGGASVALAQSWLPLDDTRATCPPAATPAPTRCPARGAAVGATAGLWRQPGIYLSPARATPCAGCPAPGKRRPDANRAGERTESRAAPDAARGPRARPAPMLRNIPVHAQPEADPNMPSARPRL